MNNSVHENIEKFQNQAINVALIIFTLFGTITQTFVTLRAIKVGLAPDFYIQTISYILFIGLTLFRHSFSIQVKVFSIFILVFITLVTGLGHYGFLASGKIYIIVIPIFISFVFKYQRAWLFLLIYTITYFVYCYLFSEGILTYNFDVNEYLTSKTPLFLETSVILLASSGLLFTMEQLRKRNLENYLEIEKRNNELASQEKKYRLLFEGSNDAIVLIRDRKYFDCNKKTYELFACDRNYIIGKKPQKFSPEMQSTGETSAERANKLFNLVSEGNAQIFDWTHLKQDGSPFDVSISLTKVVLGNDIYLQAVLRDITEKKKIERELEMHRNKLELLVTERTIKLEQLNEELRSSNEELEQNHQIINHQNEELKSTLQHLKETQMQLMQADKMASIGVLTAGVAHEINNPLNFINCAVMGLENYYNYNKQEEPPKEIATSLNHLKVGVDRISNIVNSLGSFSRNTKSFDENCSINTIIDDCLVVLHNNFKTRIEIKKMYQQKTLNIKGNCGKLHQVFLNILNNAVQAIPDKGTIEIKTQILTDKVRIEINDTGCGIASENIPKVIEPFFTTKPPGEGTGLGLSISYSIIKEHSGEIEFLSEEKKGTSVRIILPNGHHERES